MEFINSLEWRYATKRMNGQTVSQQKIDNILEAINLAPSSLGLQPFKVFVITNKELLAKIHPIAYNQMQILESSHLLVFAAWEDITDVQITDYIENVAVERGLSEIRKSEYKARIESYVIHRTAQENFEHSARQTYIALGFALAAAAVEQVDATPMEGFDTAALDVLLNLKSQGLKSVTIMPLGFRDENKDTLAKQKKIRRAKNQLFQNI